MQNQQCGLAARRPESAGGAAPPALRPGEPFLQMQPEGGLLSAGELPLAGEAGLMCGWHIPASSSSLYSQRLEECFPPPPRCLHSNDTSSERPSLTHFLSHVIPLACHALSSPLPCFLFLHGS